MEPAESPIRPVPRTGALEARRAPRPASPIPHRPARPRAYISDYNHTGISVFGEISTLAVTVTVTTENNKETGECALCGSAINY